MKLLKFAVLASTLATVLSLVSCGADTVTISRDEMQDKVLGGWAGKVIGVQFGAPHEFWHLAHTNDGPLDWDPSWVEGALDQDDIYTQLSFMETFDRYGLDTSADRLAEAFAGAGFRLYHANLQARKNWRDGLRPPYTGMAAHNAHADDIDFQIDADFIGFMCPGMPRTAREYCERIGPIMNDGDGIYGGVFIATMHSLAFFETDMLRIVEGALENIPSESAYARCVRDVVEQYKRSPDDWRAAWDLIHERWEPHVCTPDHPFNIDAKINGAYVVTGLLYGHDDLRQTMEIAVRCGQDADCNASNAAAVWGVVHGFDAIPDVYKSGLAAIADRHFAYTAYSYVDAAAKVMEFARTNVARAGGRVTDDVFRVRVQSPAPAGQCVQSFPGMRWRTSVYSDDPAWRYEGQWRHFREMGDAPFVETCQVGAAAEVEFDGRMATLSGAWDTDCGRTDVYIDGRLYCTFDSWFEERCGFLVINREVLFVAKDLAPGHHTLRLVVSSDRNPMSTGHRLMFTCLNVFD